MGFRISRINPPHLGPTYRSFSAPGQLTAITLPTGDSELD